MREELTPLGQAPASVMDSDVGWRRLYMDPFRRAVLFSCPSHCVFGEASCIHCLGHLRRADGGWIVWILALHQKDEGNIMKRSLQPRHETSTRMDKPTMRFVTYMEGEMRKRHPHDVHGRMRAMLAAAAQKTVSSMQRKRA